jgi:predicted secreted protein
MATDAADATKIFGVDLTSATTGTQATIKFNNTTNKTYTFPDIQGTVVLTVGDQTVDGKTMTNVTLNQPKVTGGSIDVPAAGALSVGSSVGANNLTLGGATSTVIVPGNLTVQGTTTSVNSTNLDVADKNITVNKGGSDASSEGAGLTVDRVGADGSLIYKDAATNKFAIGTLGAEKDIATMFDITAANLSGVVTPANGGTGVSNNNAATLTRSGNHALTITTTGTTNITLPTSGTLATTADIGASGVTGPAVSTVDRVAVWNNTTGSLLKNSLISITDSDISAGGFKTLTASLTGSMITTTAANPDLLIIPDATGKIVFKREPVSDGGYGLTLNNDANTFKTQILPGTLTANRQATMPNASGEVVLTTASQSLSAKTLVEPLVDNFQAFNHETTPTQASAGTIRVFAKSDNKIYTIDSAGVESQIGSGGTTDRITQASHGFALGDTLYLVGTTYTKAIATSAAAAEVVGVVSKIVDANNFELTLSGEVTGLTGLTAGEVYFLSAATAGLLTVTEPSTIGQVSVPVGIASSTTSLYVAPKRGVVIGGTNARANVSLTSGATTNVQNLAGYDAGELTGWVFISSAAPVRFYVSTKFAKSGAGGDYNMSYQTTGDTPPSGFSLQINTSGLLSCTLPASSGSTSVINYALNAPAIGASFPLTVDAGTILSGTVGSARLPAGQYPGSTSGAAIASGYVGEKRTATITAVNVGSGAVDVATLSLSPGVWIVTCNISIGLGSGAGATRHVFNCPANDDGLISSATSFAERATATATLRATAGIVRYVNTSSTITYSIQAQSQNATVVYPLTTSDTFLHAVRIA